MDLYGLFEEYMTKEVILAKKVERCRVRLNELGSSILLKEENFVDLQQKRLGLKRMVIESGNIPLNYSEMLSESKVKYPKLLKKKEKLAKRAKELLCESEQIENETRQMVIKTNSFYELNKQHIEDLKLYKQFTNEKENKLQQLSESLVTLEVENAKLCEKLNKFEEEIVKRDQEIEKLESKMQKLSDGNKKFNEMIEILNQEKQAFGKKNEELEQERGTLQTTLNADYPRIDENTNLNEAQNIRMEEFKNIHDKVQALYAAIKPKLRKYIPTQPPGNWFDETLYGRKLKEIAQQLEYHWDLYKSSGAKSNAEVSSKQKQVSKLAKEVSSLNAKLNQLSKR